MVKVGGHLCLYLPHKDFYPNVGNRVHFRDWFQSQTLDGDIAIEAYVLPRREQGITLPGPLYAGTPYCNPDHKHDFYPQDIIEAMEEIGGWDLVENQERNQEDEYSFFQSYRKLPVKEIKEIRHSWKVKPEKTCAVVRYGAIGDQIMASSILPHLKEQGYYVTFYCQDGPGYECIKHDPYVDRFIVQGRDEVPNPFLGEFWDYTKKKYDKWVNLCESVECALLASPGRHNWEWPNEVRAKYLDRNYIEWTHELAQVPPPYRPKFYSTLPEKAWAKNKARSYGKRNILWSLSGSSGHKTWPYLDETIIRILTAYSDVHIVLVGDELCRLLETGWESEKRVHCMSGKWTIRESMSFAEVCDLVIGCETGLLNAAGSMDCAKIVCLSHSSPEMLTKHWKHVTVLQQPKGIGCPKSPCRQLHGGNNSDTWMDCPFHADEKMKVALCQYHISPEMMWGAIQNVLSAGERMVA